MHSTREIFEGVLIPGTADYALVSARAACSVFEPEISERGWHIVRALSEAPEIPGKRVWLRVPYPNGDDAFISINPGEHRVTRPAAANDLIIELPSPSQDTLASRLKAVLEHCSKYSLYSHEIQKLRMAIDGFLAKKKPDMTLFENADVLTRVGQGNRNELIQRLFDKGLFEHGVPLFEFSAAMALLQMQQMMGQWLELKRVGLFGKTRPHGYDDPVQTVGNYVHTLAATAHRQRLTAVLTEIGNANYLDAAISVKRALNSDSLAHAKRILVFGTHQYVVALIVSRLAVRENLEVQLKYKLVQAEEGYACAQTGLFDAMHFLFDAVEAEPLRIARLLAAGMPDADILSGICSPIWPCFTRRFGRALVATARTLGPNDDLDSGLQELHSLEREFAEAGTEVNFERGWIASALLNAYKRKGDLARVQSYAVRIAGQLVVTYSLARAE